MTVKLIYKDTSVAKFDVSPGHDAVEFDLDSQHGQEIFSAEIEIDGRTVATFYRGRI